MSCRDVCITKFRRFFRSARRGAVRGTTREALDFISIKVSDATAMSEMERETEALLRQRHRIRGDAPSDFRIENPADVLIARGAAVRILGILLIAVAAVSQRLRIGHNRTYCYGETRRRVSFELAPWGRP
jgi:hypothetical protein